MKTIEERAKWFADTFIESLSHGAAYRGYVLGASEQKAIDIEKAKEAFNKTCGWLAVYPWYNGVFEEFVKVMEEENENVNGQDKYQDGRGLRCHKKG